MNIIVKTFAGNCIVRPDTTWEKDNEDFFPPDFTESLSCSPVLFAHICRPGRSIGLRFSSRYYDTINYGILLYPGNLLGGGEEDFACASCIDHTSFLSAPMFGRDSLSAESNEFVLLRDGTEIFRRASGGTSMIESALEEASKRIYVRTGDLIAVELAGRKPLWRRADGTVEITGTFCGNEILNFRIR